MRRWLSTIPVEGERSPATARTAGSRRSTASRPRRWRSSTPFAAAFAWSAWSLGASLSSLATISLPTFAYGTPCSSQ